MESDPLLILSKEAVFALPRKSELYSEIGFKYRAEKLYLVYSYVGKMMENYNDEPGYGEGLICGIITRNMMGEGLCRGGHPLIYS